MNLVRKISRMLSVILLLVLCVALPGCQKSSVDVEEDDLKKSLDINTPARISPSEYDKPDESTIVIFVQALPEGFQDIQEEINVRTRNQLGIKVIFRSWDLYLNQKKIDIYKFLGSNDYDAIILAPHAIGYESRDYFEIYFKNITKLFPQYAPQLYLRFSEDDFKQVTYNNRIYGIPCRFPANSRYCAVVDSDIVNKYQIPPIKTFEGYEELLEIIKHNEPDMYPANPNGMSLDMFIEPAGFYNMNLFYVYEKGTKSIKFIPWERTDSFANAVATLRRWQDKGYLIGMDKDVESGNKKVASFIRKMDQSFLERLISLDRDFQVYPLYPYMKTTKEVISNPAIMINWKSSKADKVLKFLEWVYASQENYDLLMYGIKGVNYELIGEDVKLLRNKDGVIYQSAFWFNVFLDPDYMRNNYQLSIDLVELYKNVNEASEYKPTGSYYFFGNRSEASDERNRVYHGHTTELMVGEFNLDPQEFAQNQRMLGIDQNLNSMQNYWEEWKEKYKDHLP